MKISHLQEGSEASMPSANQPPMRSARDPKVLETSAGATGSGSVATVSSPVGATISRNASIYGKTPKGSMLKGIKTSKKYANSAHVNESLDIPLNKIDPPDHGEPEGDFVKNQLHTIKRVTSHLERIVGNNEDLPEWVEMKISQAQGMMVAIMGYMVSSKERELEHETGEEGIMAEDEQVDGMALGELKEIVKNAKHIYSSVKNGTPLDGWMYSYVTVSNDHLNSVAEQIDNPAIREPKGVAEGHADQQRKIFKKNGKPVGEVGIDRESSPGNGQWYMKCYAYDIDNAGYDSYEEAVEELKHCLKQGVAEGQRWPDDSNSLSKRYNDRDIELMNPKDADVNWNDRKIATKIKPSITKTTVDRLDKNTNVPNFLKKKAGEDITEVYDDEEECDHCRGTGEGQFDGTSCSYCHGTGVARPDHNDDDENFDIPDDYDSLREDHIDEEVLAKKLAQQLQLFKRGVDKELGTKPKAKDLGKKPVYSNTLESVSKGSLPGAVSGIKIMSPEEFVSSKSDEEVDEATKLPAQQRELGGKEFQDYMSRIKGTDDIDKKTGKVKIDKKGLPKYTTGKTKTDKYKMPYIHRTSAIEYLTPDGKSYSEDAIKKAILQRPKSLLKQNEKMKHSNGELEQFFNIGFAALTGIAVDESTDKLIIVNTCPGAGSCKVDCFAMKGGKVQFKAAWLSDARILTYLLNDPSGFFQQLSSEISKEEALGKKGGYRVTVRWHDAGDFFSPEYMNLAFKMASAHPDVKFYAYTKIAGAALAQKPNNFIVNWSEGASTSQEKQIKAQDPNLDVTKNSRIVPEKLFYDLLAKDAKGNLKKTSGGAWQPASPEALDQIKDRLATAYNLKRDSILSYDEMMNTPQKNNIKKWNVIIAPGEGDISANRQDVLSTLLLRH